MHDKAKHYKKLSIWSFGIAILFIPALIILHALAVYIWGPESTPAQVIDLLIPLIVTIGALTVIPIGILVAFLYYAKARSFSKQR